MCAEEAQTINGYSPLDTVEAAFRCLTRGPGALVIDGSDLSPGIPARPVQLDELRCLLRDAPLACDVRDRVWGLLIGKVRTEDASWAVGVTGLSVPWLRAIAVRLSHWHINDKLSVDTAVLHGYAEALNTVDAETAHVQLQLTWAAHLAGARLIYDDLPCEGPTDRIARHTLALHMDSLMPPPETFQMVATGTDPASGCR